MTWESAVLTLLAIETAIIGWFARLIYSAIKQQLSDHSSQIKKLDRAREDHWLVLVELARISAPNLKLNFLGRQMDD